MNDKEREAMKAQLVKELEEREKLKKEIAKEVEDKLKEDHFLITRGKFFYSLSGIVACLAAIGWISFNSALDAAKDPAMLAAQASIKHAEAEAKKAVEVIQDNLAKSNNVEGRLAKVEKVAEKAVLRDSNVKLTDPRGGGFGSEGAYRNLSSFTWTIK